MLLLDRPDFEANIVYGAGNSVGARRTQLEGIIPCKIDFEFMAPGIIPNKLRHILWKEQIRQLDDV